MIDAILRDLRQPEYIHVLINPLPIYGLAMGLLGLIVAFFLRSRRAQIATLIVVLVSAASAWPVYEFGEQAYDRVLSMADEPGRAWLDEHRDRGEDCIWFFYGLAVLSAVSDFVGRGDVGNRRLHRLRRRQDSAPRISQRPAAAKVGPRTLRSTSGSNRWL